MDDALERLVRDALAEDIGGGDVTTNAIVPDGTPCEAILVAKAAGVLSGLRVFAAVFGAVDNAIAVTLLKQDGDAVAPDDVVATMTGPARSVLTGERVALNFVQRLSGVATMTRGFVDAVAGHDCKIRDTRKTTPLLRFLEKEAVVHGGGVNHRRGLDDEFLIKDNHIAVAGGVAAAVRLARANGDARLPLEVEVSSEAQLQEALESEAEWILLDNMPPDAMRKAVDMTRAYEAAHPSNLRRKLEASGNASLENAAAIAASGVGYIAVGALTHSAPTLDTSLRISHG